MAKKTKRSKSGYSKKKSYKRRKSSYVKKVFRRMPKQITRPRVYGAPYGENQVRYYTLEKSIDIVLPYGLTPGTNGNTIQVGYFATLQPSALLAAGQNQTRLLRFFQLSSKYRLVTMSANIYPQQTQVNIAGTFNSVGRIIMCPLHDQGSLIAAGAYSGGTLRQNDIDRWAEVHHAKEMKQEGGAFKPLTLNVSPSVFKVYAADPQWGVSGTGITNLSPEYTKGRWYDTRDYLDNNFLTYSNMIHWGFMIFFAGFDTPQTFQGFRVVYKYTFAFKGFDPISDVFPSPASAAAATPDTTQPEVVEYYDYKQFCEAKGPKRFCDHIRVEYEEGKEVWRGHNNERNQQIRQNVEEGKEDHYQEVDHFEVETPSQDTRSVASALNGMKRPVPASPNPQSSPNPNIKRAFTNMRL